MMTWGSRPSSTLSIFQFSIGDARRGDTRGMDTALRQQLSILYLRCGNMTIAQLLVVILPFNSLFGMRSNSTAYRSLRFGESSFNSLFEMQNGYVLTKKGRRFLLSILYLRCSSCRNCLWAGPSGTSFNSLFEMRGKWTGSPRTD